MRVFRFADQSCRVWARGRVGGWAGIPNSSFLIQTPFRFRFRVPQHLVGALLSSREICPHFKLDPRNNTRITQTGDDRRRFVHPRPTPHLRQAQIEVPENLSPGRSGQIAWQGDGAGFFDRSSGGFSKVGPRVDPAELCCFHHRVEEGSDLSAPFRPRPVVIFPADYDLTVILPISGKTP